MKLLKLRDVQKNPELFKGPITVCGWVRTVRTGKAVGFVELNDGTSFRSVQIVFPNDDRNIGKGLSASDRCKNILFRIQRDSHKMRDLTT